MVNWVDKTSRFQLEVVTFGSEKKNSRGVAGRVTVAAWAAAGAAGWAPAAAAAAASAAATATAEAPSWAAAAAGRPPPGWTPSACGLWRPLEGWGRRPVTEGPYWPETAAAAAGRAAVGAPGEPATKRNQ